MKHRKFLSPANVDMRWFKFLTFNVTELCFSSELDKNVFSRFIEYQADIFRKIFLFSAVHRSFSYS